MLIYTKSMVTVARESTTAEQEIGTSFRSCFLKIMSIVLYKRVKAAFADSSPLAIRVNVIQTVAAHRSMANVDLISPATRLARGHNLEAAAPCRVIAGLPAVTAPEQTAIVGAALSLRDNVGEFVVLWVGSIGSCRQC